MRRAALVAAVSGLVFWPNGGPATAGASEAQTISYGGYEIVVPASWPVYRLDQDPHQCVRYDVPAVYLGTPGADQQCPPGLLGRTETVSIQIPPGRPAAVGGEMIPRSGLSAALTANPSAHQFAMALSGVEVSATYGHDPGVVRRAMESLRPAGGASTDAATTATMATTARTFTTQWPAAQQPTGQQLAAQQPTGQQPTAQGPPAQWSTEQDPAAQDPATQWSQAQWSQAQWSQAQWPQAQDPAAQDPAGQDPAGSWLPAPGGTASRHRPGAAGGHRPAVRRNLAGTPEGSARPVTWASLKQRKVTQPKGTAGFDTCTAPSLQAMRSWHKRYGVAGIYIGGSNMACDYGNLNTAWVQSVSKMGWGLLPVYVGPQAPCYGYGDMINPKHAASEGQAAAADAAAQASSFGLPSDAPLYYDMEGYDETNAGCMTAVLRFLAAWTKTLNARGYISGVYSSADSGVQDLQSAAANHSIAEPQAIWFAQWDGRRTVGGASAFGHALWPVEARVKQYAGPHWETIGGVTLNIDSDLAGVPPRGLSLWVAAGTR